MDTRIPDIASLSLEQICQHNQIGWTTADDALALADLLADDIAARLQKSLDDSGAASLIVSGGSTPAPVFRKLSGCDLDWKNISISLADERWVPPGHADSNESLVRNTLMVDKASVATFIPLYRAGMTPESACEAVQRDIAGMPSPFSVVILGMGGDGHTASLFPDAPPEELDSAMQLGNDKLVAILHPPSVAQTRLSLTRSALLDASIRIVHITGDGKYPVLREALLETLDASLNDSARLGAYSAGHKPIAGLITQHPQTVSVYWSS